MTTYNENIDTEVTDVTQVDISEVLDNPFTQIKKIVQEMSLNYNKAVRWEVLANEAQADLDSVASRVVEHATAGDFEKMAAVTASVKRLQNRVADKTSSAASARRKVDELKAALCEQVNNL